MEYSNRENNCVVCFRNISIYAVGDCDHYDRICYICSTRLRVLCNKYECPICRKEIPKVIYSKFRQPFGALSKIDYPIDHKYKISFVDDDVRAEYDQLLEHACSVCSPKRAFQSFGHLKDHLRKEHHLFFCDLCVENLKLFTHERRFYNRKELGTHRRVGDSDDTSYKGHPQCQFCEERYLDKDELFRHLRKDHFFCHFCDREGHYFFYGDYKYLQDHFRDEHFLCEEGLCKEEKFVGAFNTQIDLKAHKTSQHSKNMNKQQAKQARTLELEFTYRPRPNQPNNEIFEPSARRGRKGPTSRPARETRIQKELDNEESLSADSAQWSTASAPDTHCQKEFPQLGDTTDGPAMEGRMAMNVVPPRNYGRVFNPNSVEDFPTLSGAPPPMMSVGSTRVVLSSPKSSSAANSVLFKINNKDKGGGTGNISIQVSSKPKPLMTSEDFPCLSHQSAKIAVQTNPPAAAPAVVTSKADQSKTATNPGGGKSSQDTNGWKTVKGSNKPVFEDVFPKLPEKANNKHDKRVSLLTIPVGNSSWTKLIGQNETAAPKEEASFMVVKGKGSKKAEKNHHNDQETKQKSKAEKKDKSKEKEIAKDKERMELENSLLARQNANETSSKKKACPVDGTSDSTTRNHTEKTNAKPVQNSRAEISEEEFPPLVSEKVKTPPGFTTKPNTNSNNPPPGFHPTAQSSVSASNNMPAFSLSAVARQFVNPDPTSSTLDANHVSSVPKLSRGPYIEPSNFEDRNRTLIQKIRDLLDGDEEAFLNFKTLSGQFRQNMVQAKEYYDRCISIFGKEKFLKVFPELLVLLPDIGKEQELLNVFNQVSKKENQNYGAVPKSSIMNSQNNLQVLVCATCQQVLAAKDFQKHMFYHNEDTLFPPLAGSNNATTTHITWVKK